MRQGAARAHQPQPGGRVLAPSQRHVTLIGSTTHATNTHRRPGPRKSAGVVWSGSVTSGSCPVRAKTAAEAMRPEGLEPPRVAPQDPKSCASTSSATVAFIVGLNLPNRWARRQAQYGSSHAIANTPPHLSHDNSVGCPDKDCRWLQPGQTT